MDRDEALRTIEPLIGQLEGMRGKFEEGSSQHTLLIRRIAAFRIAVALIGGEPSCYAPLELSEALRAIESAIRKLSKIPPKLREGTAQYGMVLRRMEALELAAERIKAEMKE